MRHRCRIELHGNSIKKAEAMAEELDFEQEFLDHSSTSKGSGFLSNWKEDGKIVVWMHQTAPIYSLWSHSWRRIDIGKGEDGDNPLAEIKNMRVNCLEKETLLKKQRFREDDGSREMPPVICPHCKSVEWVRAQIIAGDLDLCEPIFEFRAGTETETIYAGGFCGLFQKKDMTPEEKRDIKKRTGIRLDEAYMQNGFPRQQYVMAALADNDLDKGWVIAIETQTLGDKIKKEIRDEIKRCGGDMHRGHPRYNPYPFEWAFDDNKSFSDKYDVVALTRYSATDRVKQLLETEPPDMSHIVDNPRLGSLHKSMKSAALIDMPLDEFFEEAVEKFGFEEDEDEGESSGGEPSSPPSVGQSSSRDEPDEEDEEEPIGCDVCEAEMADDELVCKNCGAEYGENADGDVVLKKRPCGNPDCMEKKVEVNDDRTGTCGQCGAVHDEDWQYTIPEPEKKPTRRARRSKRAARRASSSK